MFHNPRKARRPSHGHVARQLGTALRECKGDVPQDTVIELDAIVQRLEAQAVNVLSWDGLTDSERLRRLKHEIVRTFMREITLNIGGKKIRRFQSIEIKQLMPDGKTLRIYHWIDVGALLVEGTRKSKDTEEGASGRQSIEDNLRLSLHQYDRLKKGIQIRIDGIKGTLKLVKEGNVTFQPSLLNMEPDNPETAA